MGVGIGVPQYTDGTGLVIGRSALDDRLLTLSDYHSLGVIRGCKVTTTSTGMTYSVGPGNVAVSVAVSSRSVADGAVKFVVPSGTISTTAAPASGARMDVVWAKPQRPDLGDSSNEVILGVTQGAASANPTAPSVPAGAVLMATYRVPSGISTTAGASLVAVGPQAVPYGAALGVLVEKTSTYTDVRIPTQSATSLATATIKLTQPRLLCFQLTGSAQGGSTVAGDKDTYAQRLVINGLERREIAWELSAGTAVFQYQEYEELPAGTHTINLRGTMTSGTGFYKYTAGRWPGQKLTIIDNGVNDG